MKKRSGSVVEEGQDKIGQESTGRVEQDSIGQDNYSREQ